MGTSVRPKRIAIAADRHDRPRRRGRRRGHRGRRLAGSRAVCTRTGLWSTNGPSTLPSGLRPSACDSESADADRRSRVTGRRLPRPVLAAAGPGAATRRRPSWRQRIAAVKVKGAKGTYSAAVIDVGTGKVLFAHRATTPVHPGLDDEAADLDRGAVDPGSRAPVQDLGGQPQGRADRPGRRRRPVPGQDRRGSRPERASITDLARDTAAAAEEAQDQEGAARATTPRCSAVRPGTRAGRPATATRSPASRRSGSTRAGSTAARRVPGRATRPRQAAEVFAAALRKQGSR